MNQVLDLLQHHLADKRLLVVGDVMLDRYWRGKADRISPEAPVPVLQVLETYERLGGAANVARNIRALGAQALLLGATGEDEGAGALSSLLQAADIEDHLLAVPDFQTIVKWRLIANQGQQLLRADFEAPVNASGALFQRFETLLPKADLVVLSDYNKGALFEAQSFIALAKKRGIPVLVDPKASTLERYRGASLVKPNLREFFTLCGGLVPESEYESRARALMKQFDIGGFLITLADKGMFLVHGDRPAVSLKTHSLEVFDVTGAGDTAMAALACALSAGGSLEEAAQVANLAAGLAVRQHGTVFVSLPELLHEARASSLEATPARRLEPQELSERLASLRSEGLKVVMTNGCFDLLHQGHLASLRAAKAEGDILVVALNSDASIRRLKGETRPIRPLEERMLLLEAMRCVDYVVPFEEDTPLELIRLLRPDVLVKGGDYTPSEIVGYNEVTSWGGRVMTLPIVPGVSTSQIIGMILERSRPA